MTASDAAFYAIVAIAFVLIGALLVAPQPSLEQRSAALGVILTALAFVAWRARRKNGHD